MHRCPARLACAFLACALVLRTFATSPELHPEELYQRILPSVLALRVENREGERFVGTAFLALEEGIAVTSWHVIHDARKVTATFADGASAEVLGIVDKNPVKDIALLRIKPSDRPRVILQLTNPPVGARAYVIGCPKGYNFSIADGLVSQIQTVDGFAQYQVSCPISPGNSGGPILNGRGEVIGVTCWSKNDAQNVNFATPVREILSLNAKSPVAAFKSEPEPPRTTSQRVKSKTKTPRELEAETAISELKQFFRKAEGKDVTIVVTQGRERKQYTFTVPDDL